MNSVHLERNVLDYFIYCLSLSHIQIRIFFLAEPLIMFAVFVKNMTYVEDSRIKKFTDLFRPVLSMDHQSRDGSRPQKNVGGLFEHDVTVFFFLKNKSTMAFPRSEGILLRGNYICIKNFLPGRLQSPNLTEVSLEIMKNGTCLTSFFTLPMKQGY